jgi:hypothetical protein
VIGVAPSVLDNEVPYFVGVGKEGERLQVFEQEKLSMWPSLEGSNYVPVTPQNGCRFGMLCRIGIEGASHDRVKHAQMVVLVGRETGIAAPTDDDLWQIIHFIARAVINHPILSANVRV